MHDQLEDVGHSRAGCTFTLRNFWVNHARVHVLAHANKQVGIRELDRFLDATNFGEEIHLANDFLALWPSGASLSSDQIDEVGDDFDHFSWWSSQLLE